MYNLSKENLIIKRPNKEVYKSASAAMDVILGRGGDQAVIREDGKYQFFGGKVEEVEKD